MWAVGLVGVEMVVELVVEGLMRMFCFGFWFFFLVVPLCYQKFWPFCKGLEDFWL